jgi:CheY-like chemotaxis protein
VLNRPDIDNLVQEALGEIERQTLADVLIIEDEPIIAMDIETIVRDLGHSVTGVAVTRDEAVAQARAHPPGLVLADISLPTIRAASMRCATFWRNSRYR